jgi:hypothetical protein
MTLYRGPGGTGTAHSDADTTEIRELIAQVEDQIDSAVTSAETATEQAIAAAASATSAASSASAASTSASNASNSAAAAATSAANASSSATSAASSASAANTSATNAAASEASVAANASAAATSAANAASSATAAAASATTASTQATNAAGSATAASTSATNAANSATTAANSASSASTSATSATASAASAATSATNAGNSASSAASSASSASTSVTSASNSASSASTSATNAATSETNAAASASSASTSATNAASSATSASSSASSAAGSASSASTSATNAASSASSAATSESNAAASAASAAAALDSFDDRYLGAKSSAPTLDNDGNALVTGALYYDTVEQGMYVYDGSQWIAASAASQAILVTYEYVATAGQTTFSGNDANGVSLSYTVGSIIVTLNGVRLRPGNDYTASTGTSVVLSVAAALNDEVVIDAFTTFDVANTYTQAQVDAALATKMTASGPAFSAYQTVGTTQSIPNATFTKVIFQTEEFDTNSNFDNATNYRFTPTVAGYYQINAQVNYSAMAATGTTFVMLYKNGSLFKIGQRLTPSANNLGIVLSTLVYFNGSTDYVEIYTYQSSGVSQPLETSGVYQNFFQAFLARSAA